MAGINDTLINFFRLTRPLSNLKNVAIILLALYFSGLKFDLPLLILGILSMSFVSSAIYGYNTISDLCIDQNNGNKKHYAEGAKFFGERKSLAIVLFLAGIGLAMGLLLGWYYFFALFALAVIGFLYSSKYTRFKEKIVLDILFGASLTFLFRFIAAWFIFSRGVPCLLPMLALVFGKTAGYTLYKSMDREYLLNHNIKNTITILSTKTLIIFSLFFSMLAAFSIFLMFLNSIYFHIDILGYLPAKALILFIFSIPPLMIIFSQVNRKTNFKNPSLRICGYIYMFLLMVNSYWVLK